jgi:hypothetical protein
MQIDITLSKARIYDVTRVDVAVGEPFTFNILEAQPEKPYWFVDNDPALDIEVSESGMEFTATAKKKGFATILIMSRNFTLLKQLTVNVETEVLPKATKFKVTVGEPVKK